MALQPSAPAEANATAVLRNFDPVDVSLGSFSTGTRPAAGLGMSAVLPKAEIKNWRRAIWDFCNNICHKRTDAPQQKCLFDHFAREQLQRVVHIEAERPCEPAARPGLNRHWPVAPDRLGRAC